MSVLHGAVCTGGASLLPLVELQNKFTRAVTYLSPVQLVVIVNCYHLISGLCELSGAAQFSPRSAHEVSVIVTPLSQQNGQTSNELEYPLTFTGGIARRVSRSIEVKFFSYIRDEFSPLAEQSREVCTILVCVTPVLRTHNGPRL